MLRRRFVASTTAMQTRLPQDPRSSFSLLSKYKIWTELAAVIVVAIGLGYQQAAIPACP